MLIMQICTDFHPPWCEWAHVNFRVDVDTAIITSTAAVFGPPFVPPIADALDNKGVLLSGLTTGLVGYAVANYLGLGLAWLGNWLGG